MVKLREGLVPVLLPPQAATISRAGIAADANALNQGLLHLVIAASLLERSR
jgi:hypothetical protein